MCIAKRTIDTFLWKLWQLKSLNLKQKIENIHLNKENMWSGKLFDSNEMHFQ